ncbi:hypothetical protein PHO31112_01380 [Pandoraea horticolens]|uniref:Transmembrane protein n=1 Tax=Pandoraea horticolens TaxID=2508298 RepID=A0A5E4TEP8_9BURK|nr:DUF6622 family protein [Pandoraea horticolens]VVD86287.1 hypothetical protein PHO31112_01380 [Pandoraea horticolens]
MSFAFLSHVPFWVWWLFVALVALGLSATRTQQKPLWAALAMPLAMTAVSAYGAANTFTTHAPALIAWASAVVIAAVLRSALGWWGHVSRLPATRRVQVSGSWLPPVWMVAIFALKFSVAVALAIHPDLTSNGGFAAWICLSYGAFSGIFLGRALAIRRAMRNVSVASDASPAS